VTTLIDPKPYPKSRFWKPYLLRWRGDVPDDLKTTLGMEMLSCRSPQMAEKELLIVFHCAQLSSLAYASKPFSRAQLDWNELALKAPSMPFASGPKPWRIWEPNPGTSANGQISGRSFWKPWPRTSSPKGPTEENRGPLKDDPNIHGLTSPDTDSKKDPVEIQGGAWPELKNEPL
jgi:hypothetical protein